MVWTSACAGAELKTWFWVIAGPAFSAGTGTGLATWGCVDTEAGVEDRACVEAWATTCGKVGMGANI